MDSLKRARELLKNIDFSTLQDIQGTGKYTLDEGRLQCEVVLRNKNIEVLSCVGLPGVRVKPHVHKQTEHYLLYEGEAEIWTPEGTMTLTILDSPHIAPNIMHSLSSKKGCKMLISRIPPIADGGY